MRLAPSAPPSFVTSEGALGERWHELARVRVELATPMLGGGSETGLPDEDQPFRPSAIRGALRHWWRATSTFADAESVKPREAALWGMAGREGSTAGRVRIAVDGVVTKGESSFADNTALPPYAKGPIMGDGASEYRVLDPGASFQVTLTADGRKHQVELLSALHAWLLFGGMGMRTRRGFGAIGHQDSAKFQSLLRKPNGATAQAGLPTLQGARLFQSDRAYGRDALAAWKAAIALFKDFRGGVPQQGGQGGRSPWPESDYARRLSGSDPLEPDAISSVPRAALGLPLAINPIAPEHQRGAHSFSPMTIEWKGGGRLASPVIVRPVLFADGWRAAILVLKAPPPDPSDLQLKRGGDVQVPLSTSVRGYPRGSAGERDSILDELCAWLPKNGMNAVPL